MIRRFSLPHGKKLLTALVLALSAVFFAEGESLPSGGPSVAVDILSKPFRLLKEKKIQSINFRFKAGTEIYGRGSSEVIQSDALSVEYSDGFTMKCGGVPVSLNEITVSRGFSDTFEAIIPGEKTPRMYPLPLILRLKKDEISCVITENARRYATDSAYAEYGAQKESASEAVHALAMIIYARTLQALKKPLHENSVFCDLTHCQVYRGRIKNAKEDFSTAEIDVSVLKGSLFFHANCGGKTFSPGVFALNGSPNAKGVSDRIASEGIWLCRGASSAWTREISLAETGRILFGNDLPQNEYPTAVSYNADSGVVTVFCGEKSKRFAAEDFRLRINRIKGWNFIRSNNYIVTDKEPGVIHFEGSGLGHGVGFCQTGAVSLAEHGFSRYEILRHYFPGISVVRSSGQMLSPDFLYCTFSLSGNTQENPLYKSFLQRRVPAGSIFKLVTACYLYAKRPDLAKGYSYDCAGVSDDKNMPDHCSDIKGHGNMTLDDALPHSCNYYFASLYQKIDQTDFYSFAGDLRKALGLSLKVPQAPDGAAFAKILCGLDYNETASVSDCIKIARFLYSGAGQNEYSSRYESLVNVESRKMIYADLNKTFIDGTASKNNDPGIFSANSNDLSVREEKIRNGRMPLMWGKTSTSVHGSNKPVSYGAFLGGSGDRGIIAIIRNGNGNLAARWSRVVLSNQSIPADGLFVESSPK